MNLVRGLVLKTSLNKKRSNNCSALDRLRFKESQKAFF